MNKVGKITERKAGIILSYVNFIVKAVVNLAFVPIMLRILGQSEYGIYQLVASLRV